MIDSLYVISYYFMPHTSYKQTVFSRTWKISLSYIGQIMKWAKFVLRPLILLSSPTHHPSTSLWAPGVNLLVFLPHFLSLDRSCILVPLPTLEPSQVPSALQSDEHSQELQSTSQGTSTPALSFCRDLPTRGDTSNVTKQRPGSQGPQLSALVLCSLNPLFLFQMSPLRWLYKVINNETFSGHQGTDVSYFLGNICREAEFFWSDSKGRDFRHADGVTGDNSFKALGLLPL